MNIIFLLLRALISVYIAMQVGKLVTKIKLPAILGWLITGIVLGPYAFNIMSNELLNSQLYYVVTKMLECSVGIMFAKDLVFKKLKKYGRQIITITLFESIGTFICVSAVFAIVFYLMEVPLYLALVFGGIALATAPAPSLSIVSEFNTKGPITNTLIPLAILDDVVAIAVFFGINSYVASLGAQAGSSLITVMATTMVAPMLIGVIIGLISSKAYKRFTQVKMLTLGTILITFLTCFGYDTFILNGGHTNYMLVGMALFTTVANCVNESKMEEIASSVKGVVGVGFILMILSLAAPLDYRLILGAGTLTVVYILSRGVGKYASTYLGAKVSGAQPTVKKYLGLALLPHSGVSLVFTGMAVTTISAFDSESAILLQGTIAAAAIINEVFAVIIAKKGFEWGNEINEQEKLEPSFQEN